MRSFRRADGGSYGAMPMDPDDTGSRRALRPPVELGLQSDSEEVACDYVQKRTGYTTMQSA